MRNADCGRESEVLALLRGGRWPVGCEDDLRAHVASCEACGDLVEVASAVLQDRDGLLGRANLPGSGLVWWRMQVRRREHAARSARRMLLFVQGLSIALSVGVAVTMVHAMAPHWLRRVASSLLPDLAIPLALLGLVVLLGVAGLARADSDGVRPANEG